MSRKKRVLRRLHLIESDLQKTAKTNSKAMWGIVSKGLIAARDIWQEGLTEKTYSAYQEIYDGLILASQQMAASEEKSIEADTISLCRELLQYLIGQTEKETAVKKDIVFLPYKASMWDSLESVWKAAYADKEHCNAYVMPIPYCDRNPDGSVAEWHCERDSFPKYVPTLDWQKVDLMAWHPDIIFYHYPYDDYNRVTSLDGRYYSRNLRQCADKLVYIPYFVLDEPCTEERVEHFVTTQGVLNADKVIVQSEAMRELYINILTKRTNQPDRAYWEERISGAGSPKIEKVLTSKKEDFEMPEKWKKLVEGKKVILYNTSLTAMLQNSDKVCDKLRYVFDVFRNRDDVVLWWRPHPLMKSTFHAMRPQYEEEYLSLEKKYIEEGWGIYDDSPDLNRAICYSDAYYGDRSSVVYLYKKINKPLMIQEIGSEFDYLKLRLSAVYMNDKYIYLSSNSYRGVFLCKMEQENGAVSIQLLKDTQGKSWNTSILSAIASGSNLYLFGFEGNNIDKFIIYNLLKDDYFSSPFGKTDGALGKAIFTKGFRFPLVYNNKIFVCAWSLPVVATIDLQQGKAKLINGDNNKQIQKRLNLGNIHGWHHSCLANGHYYVMHFNQDDVLDVDLATETICGLRTIGEKHLRFRLMASDGTYIWLGSSDGRIVKWNPNDLESYIYDEKMPTVKGQNCFSTGFMFYHEGALHMFCSYEAKNPMCVYVKFDVMLGSFSEVEYFDNVGRLNHMIQMRDGKYLLSSKYQGIDKVFLLDSISDPVESWKEWIVSFSYAQRDEIKRQTMKNYIENIGKETLAEGEGGIGMDDFLSVVLDYEPPKTTGVDRITLWNNVIFN